MSGAVSAAPTAGGHPGRVRNFKCAVCGESFHIKRYNAHWVRYMPPKFCPMCGVRVDAKEVKHEFRRW